MRLLTVGLQLICLCLCMLFKHNIGAILVYQRQDGHIISPEPVYAIPNNNRAIVRQEFGDRDMVYLITASPGDACLAKLRRPPQHFEDRLPAKFILLVDDERCDHDEGFYVKIRNAQQKGYEGVIVHPAWINKERTRPFPVDLPDHTADRIKLNLDFIGYDYGVGLRKYEFRPPSSARFFIRFTKAVDGGKAKQTKEPKRSGVPQNYTFGEIAFIFSLLAWPFVYLYCCSRKRTAHPAVRTSRVFNMGNRPYPGSDAAHSDGELEISREEAVIMFIELILAHVQAQEERDELLSTDQPLTADQVNQLNVEPVTSVTEDICPLCQEHFALDETVMIPDCNHACHVACLTYLLTKYSRRCPVCRQTIGPNN